ncbi:uncharacterized protein PAC_01476 [Phialocephala subalpina]|uniref:PiggyBac transposable element-derived protein domain-containing protein n=1 Tax=Phialocephala subalpina TaxID=576137 RepID=A0A1L7WFR9_9HELO|nr:uncharacterized protein PAC_01476 [Phialocephala subalpina]
MKPHARLRAWKPVTCEEIYAYIGIRIYMELHKDDISRDYWVDEPKRLYHPVQEAMSRDRKTSLRLWTPGRDIAIDEAMPPYEGRSNDTLVISGKSINEGYKIWVLAQLGYFFTWNFHKKGKIKDKRSRGPLGPYKVPQPKELGDNNSSAIVAHLVQQIPQAGYILYLDNLFTNVKLLTYMRKRGVGITGTCTAKSGTLKEFIDIKKKDTKKDTIPWGGLFYEPSPNGEIMLIAWKDNALVLFITSVNGELDMVEKERKRPSETSISAKTSRVPFGSNRTAGLDIPIFDDKYNNNMGTADEGNNLKSRYTLQRRYRIGGHQSLITWLLYTELVDSYLLSFHSRAEDRHQDHREFRLRFGTNTGILGLLEGRKGRHILLSLMNQC